MQPEAGIADVQVALFAEVLDLIRGGDDDDKDVDGIMMVKHLTCLGGPTFLASMGSRGRRVFSFSFSS